MNWLARLKSQTRSSEQATNATTIQSVAFVASTTEVNRTTQRLPPSNLPPPALCPVQNIGMATNATSAQNIAFVAPPTVQETDLRTVSNPDGLWQPYSQVMSEQELNLLVFRLEKFASKGLPLADSEGLAERLVRRDRDSDERKLCMECQHLQGDVGRWRCSNAHAARMAVGVVNAPLPAGMTQQLQRCPGFRADQTSAGVPI